MMLPERRSVADSVENDFFSNAGARTPSPLESEKVSSTNSLWSFASNPPVVILLVIAALDSADKSLLASSFPILEKSFGFDVKMLGYFSLFSNLSYAACMPLWGFLVHRHPDRMHSILASACLTWGIALVAMAEAGPSAVSQACLRSISGAALASILPLSQALLAELVPPTGRGMAFGLLQVCEKVAATAASSSIIYFADRWRVSYRVLGLFSVVMGVVTLERLKVAGSGVKNGAASDTNEQKGGMMFLQIIRRVAKIPALGCLIGQGLFGGIPWDCMSFVLLLMDWRGYTKGQIVVLQLSRGVSGMVGGYMGGILGDYFAFRFSRQGRVYVAITSKLGGIIFHGLFLFSTSFNWTLLWLNLFMVWGAWPVAGTIRPIMSELAHSVSERAQIVAVWILLEKSSSSVFGAPLVGYMTSDMISEGGDGDKSAPSSYKAHALAYSLFRLSTFCWVICICFWILMIYTLRPKKGKGLNPYKIDEEAYQ